MLGAALSTAVWAPSPPLLAQAVINARLTAALGGGRLVLELRGEPRQVYEIQASTDLHHWTPIATNEASAKGTVTFVDAQAGELQQRFFRLVPHAPGGPAFRADRVLVKSKPGMDLSALNLALGVSKVNELAAMGRLHVIKPPAELPVSTLIHLYEASGLVQYAEPDFYVQALHGPVHYGQPVSSPDDPYYVDGGLWNLRNTGQNGGTPGADTHAWEAWDLATSASNVIVAVINTGVRYTHQDLAANIWVNESDGSHGTNAVAGTTDPNDDYGHGTMVSGVIGAVGDNNLGVVGVCWRVQIMALKFLDASATGTISGAIACINYAQSHGAKVINASWGWPDFTSQALHDAIAGLREADIVFVAAAGNSSADNDTMPLYPASYRDLDNVIAVAATDNNDQLAGFSDYGATNVDLAAPGIGVMSCANGSDSDYGSESGTSFACAEVAGAVALLRGYFPDEGYRQIIQRILNGADPLPSLAGKTITGGRLDIANALGARITAGFTATPNSGQAPLTVQFTATSTGSPVSWNWTFGDGSTSTAQSPQHTYNSTGAFTATLVISNAIGQFSATNSVISVTPDPAPGPAARFRAKPDTGRAPLTVQFTDASTGRPVSWNWTFGDGSTSKARSPKHTYYTAGTFTPMLVVSNSAGQFGSTNSSISVTPGVTAAFVARPSAGPAPLTVQFTDRSSGAPTAWNWAFGDGLSAATRDPKHTYSSTGTFTATLTVSNRTGQSSSSSTIVVTNPPPKLAAQFLPNPASGPAPLTVQFTDQSTGLIQAWHWAFGDGSTSSAENPSHTYTRAGRFTARLTVSASRGNTSSTTRTIDTTKL